MQVPIFRWRIIKPSLRNIYSSGKGGKKKKISVLGSFHTFTLSECLGKHKRVNAITDLEKYFCFIKVFLQLSCTVQFFLNVMSFAYSLGKNPVHLSKSHTCTWATECICPKSRKASTKICWFWLKDFTKVGRVRRCVGVKKFLSYLTARGTHCKLAEAAIHQAAHKMLIIKSISSLPLLFFFSSV